MNQMDEARRRRLEDASARAAFARVHALHEHNVVTRGNYPRPISGDALARVRAARLKARR